MMRISKVLHRLAPKNQFVKNVGTLVCGTLGAQLLTLLASPFLTRLYSPDDFGLLALFASSLAIGLIVSTLRYELAIPLPKDDEKAENILGLSLVFHVISIIILLVATYLFQNVIANELGINESIWILWFFPLGLFFGGLYSILTQWTVRKKRFGKITITRFFQAFVTLSIQFLGAAYGGVSLVLGQFLGQGAGVTSLARPNPRRISIEGMSKALKSYSRFPKFSMPAGLFRVGGTELPVLFLAFSFSSSSAGLYALTMRVLSAPASLVGSAIGQVFISDAPNAHREGRLDILVKSLCLKLIHIGSPVTLIIILLGPQLFSLVFGSEWEEAGEYARWLALWIYLVFISSPLTTLTSVLEKQKQGLYFHAVMFFLRVIALFIGLKYNSVMYAIVALSIVNVLGRLFFICWLYKISGNDVTSFLYENIKAIFLSSLCLAPLIFSLYFEPSLWLIGLFFSLLVIGGRYLHLLKEAY